MDAGQQKNSCAKMLKRSGRSSLPAEWGAHYDPQARREYARTGIKMQVQWLSGQILLIFKPFFIQYMKSSTISTKLQIC